MKVIELALKRATKQEKKAKGKPKKPKYTKAEAIMKACDFSRYGIHNQLSGFGGEPANDPHDFMRKLNELGFKVVKK